MSACVYCHEGIRDGTRLTLYCGFCRKLHTPFRWSA